ncbi:hypothetical protein ACO2I3_15280 [Leptospira interrogans]
MAVAYSTITFGSQTLAISINKIVPHIICLHCRRYFFDDKRQSARKKTIAALSIHARCIASTQSMYAKRLIKLVDYKLYVLFNVESAEGVDQRK